MHVVRSCLMQQEEEKQRRRQQEAERSAKYFEQQQLELTKYKDQLTQLQAAKEEKQKQMSAEINRMVADAHEKRERQKKAKMQAELREVDRAKAKTIHTTLNMATPMGVLVAKRVEKLRLQEYENEMTQAYQKRLAAQELARKADLQKTYERQEKRVSMALLNVVSPEEKARQDEVRAAVVQAAERKKEEARLEEKRRKQRQLDAEQGQELRKQQEEKRNRLEAERQAAAHIDAMGAQDALAAEMAARVKQAKKDAIDREYRTRKATMDKWSMSHIEMKLNSTTLKKAVQYLHAHTTFFTRNMTKVMAATSQFRTHTHPTFTVRDGYHLEQLNHKSCSDVEWRNYPELAPPAATPVKDTPSRYVHIQSTSVPVENSHKPPFDIRSPWPGVCAAPSEHSPPQHQACVQDIPLTAFTRPNSRRTRYDTQISMIRKRTIVPVADPRSMSLGARILHFKIAPHELQAVLKREDARKLRHITDHGTNLVARNKQLVKPPSNQVSQAICLSHVTHAMLVIQKYLMKWVRKNRLRRRQLAVHVIITSIEELQEAKFRRV
ncbi:hypothetical protein B5M09_007677 [Aphanomyces astaci]|uniref:Uncharacterized protein n=1 Tax=Aphanomyces astaci TaxID=112090 RepID=A0A3R7WDH6_APHAT|nr:hypothetical protein B5M09_007677 [Aphanomyces astaci]